MTINSTFGTFRVVDRDGGGVRTTREPIGPAKLNGPRLGLDGWIFGHQTTVPVGMWCPPVGLERKQMGLGYPQRPQGPKWKATEVGGQTPKTKTGKGRGKGRRRRKMEQIAAIHARQDECVRKINKRKKAQAKLARDREMSSRVQVARRMASGGVASVLTNPAFEVVS